MNIVNRADIVYINIYIIGFVLSVHELNSCIRTFLASVTSLLFLPSLSPSREFSSEISQWQHCSLHYSLPPPACKYERSFFYTAESLECGLLTSLDQHGYTWVLQCYGTISVDNLVGKGPRGEVGEGGSVSGRRGGIEKICERMVDT